MTGSGIEQSLLELVKLRVSQINGCAYCIDMHSKDARAAGETEQRLYAVSAWHETPFFTEPERAALALAEAVTLVADTHVPATVLEAAASHFSPQELTKLVYAIIEIKAWTDWRSRWELRNLAATSRPNSDDRMTRC